MSGEVQIARLEGKVDGIHEQLEKHEESDNERFASITLRQDTQNEAIVNLRIRQGIAHFILGFIVVLAQAAAVWWVTTSMKTVMRAAVEQAQHDDD